MMHEDQATCECGCECGEPATTTTTDEGVRLCDACADYYEEDTGRKAMLLAV